MTDKNDLAYVAGLFDGDGWFSINVKKHPTSTLGYNISPSVGIKMKVQSGGSPARAAVESVLDREANVKHGTYDEMWMVQAEGSSAVEAIELLSPHLRLKQPQADVIQSVDWSKANHSADAFLEAAKVRDELRAMQGRNESKYDYAVLKEEIQQ